MCGIAGVLAGPQGRPVARDELERMVAVQRHRGPDGWGLYRGPHIALAHARLSIVGLADGHQPLANEDGSLRLSANGEIFNHVELRAELTARGHVFATGSDCEAILHAYEEWGEGAWGRLNGQFAFALWDGRKRLLWLVRDGFGILPLHWARVGQAVVFASEAKALFAGGRIQPSFDPHGLALVFSRWSATAPSTVFQGVRSVRPGAALCIDADLHVVEHRHWRPHLVTAPQCRDWHADEAAEALGAALMRSIKLRLRADVPVGCYVSGGLDSSVIAALAGRVQASRLDSFAIRFADPAFDETAEQRLMAAHAGTRHHEMLVDSRHIAASLRDVVWHCETPLLRTAPVPLFLLSGLVRDSGRKVVLTGEGADELLAGYNIFKEDRIRRFWARRPESEMRPQLLSRLYPYVAGGKAQSGAFWRRFFGSGLDAVDDPFFSHAIRWRNTAWSLRFLSPDIQAALDAERMEFELETSLPPGWRQWEPLARAQVLEQVTFMSSYLLSSQGDRVAMAHGIEVRYPFLDPEVVALCGALPARTRLLGLRDKVALRRLARDLVPSAIAQRPKRPYRAPVAQALFGKGAEWVDEVLGEDSLRRHGLAAVEPALKLAAKARNLGGRLESEREEMALIGLATLQVLADQYLDHFASRVAEAVAGLKGIAPLVAEEGRAW